MTTTRSGPSQFQSGTAQGGHQWLEVLSTAGLMNELLSPYLVSTRESWKVKPLWASLKSNISGEKSVHLARLSESDYKLKLNS